MEIVLTIIIAAISGGVFGALVGLLPFYIGKNAKVKYTEKHYGQGEGTGENVMNPETVVYMEEGSQLQMDTAQIAGIDSSRRDTRIICGKEAEVVITERLLTHGKQWADSDMDPYDEIHPSRCGFVAGGGAAAEQCAGADAAL